jgi:hypothetical protein
MQRLIQIFSDSFIVTYFYLHGDFPMKIITGIKALFFVPE